MREYNLARQGYDRGIEHTTRREANWMAMILSTQYSEGVTAAQLLGEDEPVKNLKKDMKQAEARMRRIHKAMAKRRVRQ